MCVTGVAVIPSIRRRSSVPKRAIGEVAFDAGAPCSVGMVEVPAPRATDQFEAVRSAVDGEVRFCLDRLDQADVVVWQFWGDSSNGVPVLQ